MKTLTLFLLSLAIATIGFGGYIQLREMDRRIEALEATPSLTSQLHPSENKMGAEPAIKSTAKEQRAVNLREEPTVISSSQRSEEATLSYLEQLLDESL